MRASEASSTGGVGVTEVSGLFERIRWAPLENRDRHDLGTDLLVAVRDPRRFDRGALIGVQVKGGPSWFSEPVRNQNEEVVGWWHRNDNEHFDYWVKHGLPHLVVLYDLDAREGYWVHVTADRCEATGKGLKIFVPKENTISERDAHRLLEIALAQRGSISLEGTAFDAASAQLAPGDRLRCALLIPRLIAPHPNRSASKQIEPEEAIALLVLLHVPRLQERLEKCPEWAKLDQPPSSNDWRWHFAYALWRFIAYGETNTLREVYANATREDWRAAATATLVAAELAAGNISEGIAIIDAALTRDKAAPVDFAWLHLHAASLAVEGGLQDVAKTHATQATRALASIGDDPTSSLLSGIAYRTLFSLASWKENAESISETLRAGDNAGSWWRDQQLRWALDAVALAQFRGWAKDTASRWDAEPPIQQLLPSLFMAIFSADHIGWAAAESRLGRYGVQSAQTESEFRLAFARLLNSGDKASVILAGRKAWNFGPAQLLADLSAECVPSNFSPNRLDALLTFWQEFGELGVSSAADDVVIWCLDQAVKSKTGHNRGPTVSKLLAAITGALDACSSSVRMHVSKKLNSIPVHWTHISELSMLASTLERYAPEHLDTHLLLSIANSGVDQSELAKLLGLAAKLGSPEALSQLIESASSGNLLAGAIAFQGEVLPETAAKNVIDDLVNSLQDERKKSAEGKFGYGRSVDQCLFLVGLNFRFPNLAKWDVVIAYLGDSTVIADHKELSIYRVIRDVTHLPKGVAESIVSEVEGLRKSRYLPKNLFDPSMARSSASGLADLVQFGLGNHSDMELEKFISSTLTSDDSYRRMGWRVLWKLKSPGYDMLALKSLSDDDIAIRDGAARFVALRVDNGIETPALRSAVEKILSDSSVLVPRAFVSELSERCPSWVIAMIRPLQNHPAASVRDTAHRLIDHKIVDRNTS